MHDRPPRRGIWLPLAQFTTMLGLVCAVSRWGVVITLVSILTMAIFAWGILATMWSDRGSAALPRIIGGGVTVGVIGTAFPGLAYTLGLPAVLFVGALAVTHPLVRIRIRAWRAALVSGTAMKRPAAEDLRNLTDATLCAAWQCSHEWLRTSRTATEEAAVAQLRQDYLDELERRDPEGLAAWFASGAQAEGSPLPFLGQGHGLQT